MIWTLVLFVLDAVKVLALTGFQICLPLVILTGISLVGVIVTAWQKGKK
ncbi:MAG: hypothetical protein WCQ61_10575 [Proteiniphilum sp.]